MENENIYELVRGLIHADPSKCFWYQAQIFDSSDLTWEKQVMAAVLDEGGIAELQNLCSGLLGRKRSYEQDPILKELKNDLRNS